MRARRAISWALVALLAPVMAAEAQRPAPPAGADTGAVAADSVPSLTKAERDSVREAERQARRAARAARATALAETRRTMVVERRVVRDSVARRAPTPRGAPAERGLRADQLAYDDPRAPWNRERAARPPR